MSKLLQVVFALVILVTSTGCQSEAPQQATSERLVGHWATSSNDHLYFSAIEADGRGRYTLIQPNGRTFRHHYRIVSQNPTERRLVVEFLFADGDKREETCVFSSDGATLTTTTEITGLEISTEHRHVDGKTDP